MSLIGDASRPLRRDRKATEQRILQAVGTLLARNGFRALGINAVAREAGVDKVLIYRYFGGLPDLLAAYGHSGRFWWTLEDMVGSHLPPPATDTRAAWTELFLRRHVAALRERPVTQEILAWELVERNALTATLAEIREARNAELGRWLAARFGDPGDRRWRGVLAVLGAAANYLVARARTVDRFAGINLRTDDGWAELETAVGFILERTAPEALPCAEAVSATVDQEEA